MNTLEWMFRPSTGRGGIISNRSAQVVYFLCSSVHDIQPIGGIYLISDHLSSCHTTGLLKRRSDWQQAPPPQMNQERVAAWARERPSGNTLFSSFLGRGREEEKDVLGTLCHTIMGLDKRFSTECNPIKA